MEKRTEHTLHPDPQNQFIYCTALAGMQPNLNKWQPLFQSFASFLWQKNKSPFGLKNILESVFQCKAEIKQFIRQWIKIAEENQAKLDGSLLKEKALGTKALCAHQAIKVRLHINTIEELEAKIAPDDNGETVLPLPKKRCR